MLELLIIVEEKKFLKWNYFSPETVDLQFIKAVDSISANIAEDFGRYNEIR
ncbi:MAG TPA: hypothetical protein PL045_02420 [Chitinophagaceae bacterium]|nr:hypothetical protein [Chitinophagaceae bacterium]